MFPVGHVGVCIHCYGGLGRIWLIYNVYFDCVIFIDKCSSMKNKNEKVLKIDSN